MKIFVKFLLTVVFLVVSVGAVSAQVGGNLVYGDSVTGSLSQASPLAFYTFTGNTGDVVSIRAIALSPTAELTITLLSPSQQLAARGDGDPFNLGSLDARVDARLAESGLYSILIGGVNAATGDFLLRLDGRGPVSPLGINSGVPIVADFTTDPSPKYFSMTSTEPAQLTVLSQTPGFLFNVTIWDAAGVVAAVVSGQPQVSLTLPGGEIYEIAVTPALSELLGTVELSLGAGTTPAQPPTSVPAVPAPTDRCTVSSGGAVNVRSGAGTNFSIIGSLSPGQFLDVLGVTSDRAWYAVNFNGSQGWVSASVVVQNGPCSNIAVVQAPAAPVGQQPVAPTPTPTLVQVAPGAVTATPTATQQAGAPPTATATVPPAAPTAPPDNDYRLDLDRNSGAQFSEVISHPAGDRSDRVTASVTNFDSVTTFAQYNVVVVCSGTGAEFVRWGTTANAINLGCNASVNMIFTTDSNNNNVFVTLPDGSGTAYVNYTIIFTKIG